MSIIIDANNDPDLVNYKPNSGGNSVNQFKIGNYPGTFQINNIEGVNGDYGMKAVVTFECLSGDISGEIFDLDYLTGFTGNNSQMVCKIAKQNLMDLTEVITGNNITNTRFEFGANLYGRPFNGVFCVEATGRKDDNGNDYKRGKFKQLKPVDNQSPVQTQQYQQPPVQTQQYQQQPVQNAQNQGQQPTNNGQPSWANR